MLARLFRWPNLVLLLILLLAVWLRFWQLDSLPPGLYHDEAYNGLDALSLLSGETFPQFYEGWELYAQDAHAGRPPAPQRYPVFFEGNYGREPLHVYLMALSIGLLGNTAAAVRAVPAVAGVLAVLATYLAARALFPPDKERLLDGELVPLVAAFTVAIVFPAVHFSRFGIRAMLFLPCAALSVWAFWHGWRATGRRAGMWLAPAGFFVGLGFYTYAAARLFPLVYVGFALYLAFADRPALIAQWRGIAIAATVALITAAPLLLFFGRYPYFAVFRIGYVANRGAGVVEGSPLTTWFLNVGRVLRGLFWQGETHLRHNLPGRPYLDPLQAALVLTGVARSLRRPLRQETMFLLIWFGVMLLPSILSGDAPHFGRLIGAATPLAIFIGLGVEAIARWVALRSSRPAQAAAIAGLLLCLPSAILSARDYFGRYASLPQLAADFYQSDWLLGQQLANATEGTTLYYSPAQAEMATIYFALGDAERLHSFTAGQDVLPAGIPGATSLYALRDGDAAARSDLESFFGDAAAAAGSGEDPFVPVPADTPGLVPAIGPSHDFGGEIRLSGWSLEDTPGQLAVTLRWEGLSRPARDYTAFVHLVDEAGTLIAQSDRPPAGYPTSDWRAGEQVIGRYRLELPPELPQGELRLLTGFYYLPTLERLGEPAQLTTLDPSTMNPQ